MSNERQPTADERAGMEWWNELPEDQREFWLWASESAVPWCAWNAWKRNEAVQRMHAGNGLTAF